MRKTIKFAFILSLIYCSSCSLVKNSSRTANTNLSTASKPLDMYGFNELKTYLDTVRPGLKWMILDSARTYFFLWKADTGGCLGLRDYFKIDGVFKQLKRNNLNLTRNEVQILLGKPSNAGNTAKQNESEYFLIYPTHSDCADNNIL